MRLTPRRRQLVSHLALGALVISGHGQQELPAVERGLPARLSDGAFWRMMNDMSEAGGSFLSDNFVSNELAFQWVIPALRETVKPGGVYVGVGPDQNFTYITALRPRIAFIVDIRRQNMMQHLMYKGLIEMSKDRADFVARLFSRPRPAGVDSASTAAMLFDALPPAADDHERFQKNLTELLDHLMRVRGLPLNDEDRASIEYVYTAFYEGGPELTYTVGHGGRFRGGYSFFGWPTYQSLMVESDGDGVAWSYLADERNFRYLKDMHERNMIIPIVGDFAGPLALRKLAEYLTLRQAPVSVFYVSNVEQYLFQDGWAWRRFYENLALLPTVNTTTMIRSVPNRGLIPFQLPNARAATVTASIPALVAAFKDGRIERYEQAVLLERE